MKAIRYSLCALLLFLAGCASFSRSSRGIVRRFFVVELELRNDSRFDQVVKVETRDRERLVCPPERPSSSDLRPCEAYVSARRSELMIIRWEGESELLPDGSEVSNAYIDIEVKSRAISGVTGRADQGSMPTSRVCRLRLEPEHIAATVLISNCQ